MRSLLKKPLVIRGRKINSPLFLAPMAGIGNVAFRQLVAEFGGAGLLFTGMCSDRAVPHENRLVSPVFRWRDDELPFCVCQIFGSAPETMAKAAQRIEAEGFFGVDLNFGCSVAAICKKGAGAALLKDPVKASDIVRAVRSAVSIPVMVKFRTGWKNDPEYAARMAAAFEAAGADALTFHPRVAPDRRNRPPRWDQIGYVKQAVKVPVFGNGNIFDEADGIKMIQRTGCDGLSIGRAAVAKPWIFAQLTNGFEPDQTIYLDTAVRMLSLLARHYNEVYAVKLFKKFVPYFSANFKFGHDICKKMLCGNTIAELEAGIRPALSGRLQINSRPNLNLF